MHFGGKKEMYGVADYLSESTDAKKAVRNGNVQIGNGVSIGDLTFVPVNGNNDVLLKNESTIVPSNGNNGNANKNVNTTANGNGNGTSTTNTGAVTNNNNGEAELPNADQTALAVADLDYLRAKLGESNFAVLSGDDERVVAVFASPGEASAKAELANIDNAGALIDTFALLDVLLNDSDVELSDERRALLETVREATRARLTEVLGTGAPVVPPIAAGPITVTQCIKRMGSKDKAIVGLSILVVLLVFITGLIFHFRRKCPQPGM